MLKKLMLCLEQAGNNGGSGMAFMGMGVNAAGSTIGAFQQPVEKKEDPYEKLTKMKQLVDAGVLTQEEFDKAKKDLLGL